MPYPKGRKPMEQDWRFEASTMTIRTNPGNHWVCSMNSFDGALDHEANARRIAALPELVRLAAQAVQWAGHLAIANGSKAGGPALIDIAAATRAIEAQGVPIRHAMITSEAIEQTEQMLADRRKAEAEATN